MELCVAFFETVKDTIVTPFTYGFGDFVAVLEEAAREDRHRSDKTKTLSFIPASFNSPYRAKGNITYRHAFALDVDGDKPGHLQFREITDLLDGLGIVYVAHSTTKSTNAVNRYRVIFPCEPIAVADYEAACSSIDQALSDGRGLFDSATYDASRLNFVPQRWHGIPADHPDFDEADGHMAFHANLTGTLLPVAEIVAAYPPIEPEPEAPAIDIAAILAARQLTHVHDLMTLVDFDRSPLITEKMVSDYHASSEGGRYYRFLCQVAARALHKGLPCEVDIIHSLGQDINFRGSHSKRRSRREAERAIRWAVANHAPKISPKDSELHAALNRRKQRRPR